MPAGAAFDRTQYLYAISTRSSDSGVRTFSLSRYREASNTLADRVVLLDEVPAAAGAAAASLRFGPDGMLFAAFDDAGMERLRDDLASVNGNTANES
jgi:glucose/arabinose dehydrogenase